MTDRWIDRRMHQFLSICSLFVCLSLCLSVHVYISVFRLSVGWVMSTHFGGGICFTRFSDANACLVRKYISRNMFNLDVLWSVKWAHKINHHLHSLHILGVFLGESVNSKQAEGGGSRTGASALTPALSMNSSASDLD